VLAEYLRYPPTKNQLRRFAYASTEQLISELDETKFYEIIQIGIYSADILNMEFLTKARNVLKSYSPLDHQRTLKKRISRLFKLYELFQNSYFEKIEKEGIKFLNSLPKREILRIEVNILLALISIILRKYQEALQYARVALELSEKFDLPWRKSVSLLLIANSHYQEGKFLLSESIMEYILETIDYEDHFINFVLRNNLGLLYYHLGKFDKAYKYLTNAYKEYKNVYPPAGFENVILQNIAKASISIGDLETAEKNLLKSLEISMRNSQDPSNYAITNTLLLLSQLYGYLGETSKLKRVIRYCEKLKNNSPSFNYQIDRTRNIILAYHKMMTGDFGSAKKILDKINFDFTNDIKDLMLWEVKIYVDLILYAFTLNRNYLADATKCFNALESIEGIIDSSLTNSQIVLLKVFYYYAIQDVDEMIKEIDRLHGLLNQLHDESRNEFIKIINYVESKEEALPILPLSLFFKLSLFINWRRSVVPEKIDLAKPIDIVFYTIKDFIGPYPMYQLFNKFEHDFILKQGAFLTTLVGGGDQYNEGFWGPMPTSDPNIVAYVGTKKLYDPDADVKDERKPDWTYALLVFFVDEKTMHDQLIRKKIYDSSMDFYSRFKSIKEITEKKFRKWAIKHFRYDEEVLLEEKNIFKT